MESVAPNRSQHTTYTYEADCALGRALKDAESLRILVQLLDCRVGLAMQRTAGQDPCQLGDVLHGVTQLLLKIRLVVWLV